MRVALLAFGFPEYCIQQANGLARECDVLLMLPHEESAEYASLIDPAVEFRPFKKARLRQPGRQFIMAASLLRQIRQFRADVVHFQQGHLWFNFALPFLRRVPLVITIHDPRYHVGDWSSRTTPQSISDFGFRRADRVIVHGEALKRQVIDVLGMRAEKVHVIPHVAMGNGENSGGEVDDGRTVLFFGRIWEYKGLRYLIEAEPLVARALPDVRIVIGGEGEDFETYRRMMNGSRRFVVHNRFVTATERDELFRQASLVVLPYVDATQSGVIPVAYSHRKAVVATNTGALAEAVDDGVTGLLVPPRNVEALAHAIIELLSDPERRHAMGAAGRRKLDAEWSPQAVAQQSMEVYRRAIRDREPARQQAASGDRVALEVKQC